jgi:tRNA U34 5-methylaminomethyl-2-thiouridine-forming methyltransferase MnmC
MPNVEVLETRDGSHTLFSKDFGYTYHSKFGALQESNHVFIEAGLKFKSVLKKRIQLLEIGFGTGLNAYLTALEAYRKDLIVHYTGYEAYPVAPDVLSHLNYEQVLVNDELSNIFHAIHAATWGQKVKLNPHFYLEKIEDLFENIAVLNQYDLIYYDAFAPDAQPHLWNETMMRKMYDCLKKDGILVTYCSKGDVKRALKAVGFTIEKIPGPPGKREMTRAFKS